MAPNCRRDPAIELRGGRLDIGMPELGFRAFGPVHHRAFRWRGGEGVRGLVDQEFAELNLIAMGHLAGLIEGNLKQAGPTAAYTGGS